MCFIQIHVVFECELNFTKTHTDCDISFQWRQLNDYYHGGMEGLRLPRGRLLVVELFSQFFLIAVTVKIHSPSSHFESARILRPNST